MRGTKRLRSNESQNERSMKRKKSRVRQAALSSFFSKCAPKETVKLELLASYLKWLLLFLSYYILLNESMAPSVGVRICNSVTRMDASFTEKSDVRVVLVLIICPFWQSIVTFCLSLVKMILDNIAKTCFVLGSPLKAQSSSQELSKTSQNILYYSL